MTNPYGQAVLIAFGIAVALLVALALVMSALAGVLMVAWNLSVVTLLGAPALNYAQSVGITALLMIVGATALRGYRS